MEDPHGKHCQSLSQTWPFGPIPNRPEGPATFKTVQPEENSTGPNNIEGIIEKHDQLDLQPYIAIFLCYYGQSVSKKLFCHLLTLCSL